MSNTATEKREIVEQIVEALKGDPSERFEDLVTHAGELKGVTSMAKLLREHVEAEPDDAGPLEALVILCFARPKLQRRVRFNLVVEARRLAALIRRDGDPHRAQEVLELLARATPGNRRVEKDLAAVMRRTGNTDQLVEQYMARAAEAESRGRRRDAITWLREVLLLDPGRRDAARMIRDLQYESRRVKGAWRRTVRIAGLLVVLAAGVFLLVTRDMQISQEYRELPAARQGDRQSLEQRLASVDALIQGNPLWLGMFAAGRERGELRSEIERLHAQEAREARQVEDQLTERRIHAETALVRARRAVEALDMKGAIEQYELALGVAPEDWSERERAEADLAAVKRFEQEQDR